MNIEDLTNQLDSYKENMLINTKITNKQESKIQGKFILNNGDIYVYQSDNQNTSLNKIVTIDQQKIENLKNYLLNNVKVFEKHYQQIHIDNIEYNTYIKINDKQLSLTNDYTNLYDPTLYKDLCFKINYMITESQGINEQIVNNVINTNKVEIKSSLQEFDGEIKIYKTLFKKQFAIKIRYGISIYKSKNKKTCYWAIRLLKEKYNAIFNAKGANYIKNNNKNFLLANFKDKDFITIEEKEALKNALLQLFNEIKSL